MTNTDDRQHPTGLTPNQAGQVASLGAQEFVENDDVAASPEVVRIVPVDVAHRRESTRANLALGLTALLALVVLIVALTPILGGSTEATQQIAGLLLSPLFGLVGAATGFYYGGRITG